MFRIRCGMHFCLWQRTGGPEMQYSRTSISAAALSERMSICGVRSDAFDRHIEKHLAGLCCKRHFYACFLPPAYRSSTVSHDPSSRMIDVICLLHPNRDTMIWRCNLPPVCNMKHPSCTIKPFNAFPRVRESTPCDAACLILEV
jgi:hypothetical protein